VEDWAEIRRLRRAEGMPILAIARVMGVDAGDGGRGADRVAALDPGAA
jgi:hypothetical protein